MDVTPQLIEQIDFSERRFGGYDPDQVDDFLERVGATISRLESELASETRRADQAEASLADLKARPPAAPSVAPSAAPIVLPDSDVEQATSTLLLAKRTAEAAINEARSEATKLLADSRARVETETRDAAAEAERLVREAQTQRDDLLRTAREEADAEFAGQRERLKGEIAQLDAAKQRLGGDIGLIEARLDEYRSALTTTRDTIGRLLEDPGAMASRPALDVDMTPTVTSSAPESAPPAERVSGDDISVVTEVPEGTQAAGDPWGPGSWAQVSAALDDSGEGGDEAGVGESEQPAEARRGARESDLGERAPAGGDDEVFRPRVDPVESVGRASTVDEPTAAYTPTTATGEHDRYLQELHDAVNTEVDPDPAMEEFFEGESERPKRFGRKR